MTIELDTTLAQAEVLFLSFAQLVADIDHRQAEDLSLPTVLRHRKGNSVGGSTSEALIVLPTISENLRELLNTDRP